MGAPKMFFIKSSLGDVKPIFRLDLGGVFTCPAGQLAASTDENEIDIVKTEKTNPDASLFILTFDLTN